MPTIYIDDINDPRVQCFRDLPRRHRDIPADRFVTEGPWVTERLLQSDYVVASLLVTQGKASRFISLAPPEVPIYVVSNELASQIVGVQFHMGVLAYGIRKPIGTLEQFVASLAYKALVVCDGITNQENLGAIIRTAAAFGAGGVICDTKGTDPLSRRASRVSMGYVFHLPLYQCDNTLETLQQLQSHWQYQAAATVISPDALPLEQFDASKIDRLAWVFGCEGYGLSESVRTQCDFQLTIPIQAGVDSLNVVAATAICLYQSRV